MKMTFLTNACAIFEKDGFRFLTDPWLTDGAFDGSWFHYPALKTRPEDVTDVDAIYITHLHGDHYDPETLKHFRRDIPIVVLDKGKNYLTKLLRAMGFTNLVHMKDGEERKLGPFTLTMYGPFQFPALHAAESKLLNLIESSMVISDGKSKVFDICDNLPDIESARKVRERHGPLTLALLPYNGAGPYPSCFHNMNAVEKKKAERRILDRNFKHMAELVKVLEPKYSMPFAGDFVLGGRFVDKNEHLGATIWDEPAEYLERVGVDSKPLVMCEGMTLDLDTGALSGGPYRKVDFDERAKYLESLRGVKFPYEHDSRDPKKIISQIKEMLPISRANLWKFQKRFEIFYDTHVYLKLLDDYFHIPFDKEFGEFLPLSTKLDEPYLRAELDLRYLDQILRGEAHWDNAETGCHIEYERVPDVYLPDLPVLMEFFHLPVQPASQKVGAVAPAPPPA